MPPKSNFIKQFVLGLRLVELESAYIVLSENMSPKLYEYVETLGTIQFVDGHYHTYCGEVKEVVNNFINYWMEIMNHTLEEADRLGHFTPWQELQMYMADTINTHLRKQVDFGRMYLPVENAEEEKSYRIVNEKFDGFMESLYILKQELDTFDLRESLQEFLKGHFDTSVKKKNAIFEYTHTFIAECLATKLYEIRTSIEEILCRVRLNLKKMQDERDTTLRHLLQNLYDGNKEQLTLSRKERRSSKQLAEVECSIKRIRERIEDHQMDIPITHLNAEMSYWVSRLDEFGKIETTLKKLRAADDDLKRYEKLQKSMEVLNVTDLFGTEIVVLLYQHQAFGMLFDIIYLVYYELGHHFTVYLSSSIKVADLIALSCALGRHRHSPIKAVIRDCRVQLEFDETRRRYQKHTTFCYRSTEFKDEGVCWKHMAGQIEARRQLIDEKTLEASKALVTFFAVRGLNRIFYNDRVGKYIVDEYGHQIYFFDHGSFKAHLNCEGAYKKVNENEQKYYFDDFGRHVFDDMGEKTYQCAPCTSHYKLGEDNLLIKITKDCGHSEKKNPHCKLELKDPTNIELLPSVDPVDIKDALPAATVKYLWENFGGILTKSLNSVGLKQSNNPIQNLAHELLRNKYRITPMEIQDSAKEAEVFRHNVYTEREQKAIAASKAWKKKQVKHRKPEESDDTYETKVFEDKLAGYQFVCDINKANEN